MDMGCCFLFCGGNLRRRVVIDVTSAERIGYVSDMEIDESDGRVCAVIVRRHTGFLSSLLHIGEMSVPWEAITAVGDEFVLVKTFEFGEKYLK